MSTNIGSIYYVCSGALSTCFGKATLAVPTLRMFDLFVVRLLGSTAVTFDQICFKNGLSEIKSRTNVNECDRHIRREFIIGPEELDRQKISCRTTLNTSIVQNVSHRVSNVETCVRCCLVSYAQSIHPWSNQ